MFHEKFGVAADDSSQRLRKGSKKGGKKKGNMKNK
jgi:hypothetical protein